MKKVSAVVLAAGKGKRMKSDLPKVLLPVLGRPMARYVIDNLGFCDEIIVVGGYGFDALKEELSDLPGIRFAYQEKQLGTADAVKSAFSIIGDCEYVAIACGDMPLLRQSYMEGLMAEVVSNNAAGGLLYARAGRETSLGRVIVKKESNLIVAHRIVEKADLEEEDDTGLVNTGFYIVRRDFLEKALDAVSNDNRQKEYYLTDIVSIASENGEMFIAMECPFEQALGANSRKDLSEIEALLLEEKIDKLLEEGVTVLKRDSVYIEWDVEIGKGTEILPFCVIRKGVKIGNNCKIGPFAHIRPGTELKDNVCIGDFVEVNRSVLEEGSQAKHLAYLGDAHIGRDVNVGAGVITANYDGRNKHKTEVDEGAFIGSGAILVAPCKVGREAVLGAGAVLTKGKEVGEGSIFVGVPAREFKKEESVDG